MMLTEKIACGDYQNDGGLPDRGEVVQAGVEACDLEFELEGHSAVLAGDAEVAGAGEELAHFPKQSVVPR
jgi:hypothetical protein